MFSTNSKYPKGRAAFEKVFPVTPHSSMRETVSMSLSSYLLQRLLGAKPDEFAVIRDSLSGHSSELIEQLWSEVDRPAGTECLSNAAQACCK